MHRMSLLVVALAAFAGHAEAAEEDLSGLVGLWVPEDQSSRTVEFTQDGVFNYRYFATLRLRWEAHPQGRVNLLFPDGTVVRTCHYTIEGDRLLIDDGSGGACVTPSATPPDPMPLAFYRAP